MCEFIRYLMHDRTQEIEGMKDIAKAKNKTRAHMRGRLRGIFYGFLFNAQHKQWNETENH